jgi:putative MATE family efflux protein
MDSSRQSPSKAFALFLVPILAANLLRALSDTLNSIYLGRLLGVKAIAAVSAFSPVFFFLISLAYGIGAGAFVLTGQAWGAKDYERVKIVAGTALMALISLGIILAILGSALARLLLNTLGTPLDIIVDAVTYARVMFIAMPGMFVPLLISALARGVGDATTPLFAFTLLTLACAILTPALLLGWGGLPTAGVASGAYATVASLTIVLIWLGAYLNKRKHPLAPDIALWRNFRLDWKILRIILRVGLPIGTQNIIVAFAEVVVLSFINRFGSDATAATGAVNQILNYVQFPILSISVAASALSAQAIGAGNDEKLLGIIRTGAVFNLVITGSLVLLAYIFSYSAISIFIVSKPVVDLAQSLLQTVLWSIIIVGLSAVLTGVMRGSGDAFGPMCISIFAVLFLEIPTAYLLGKELGINGIWIAYPITFMQYF